MNEFLLGGRSSETTNGPYQRGFHFGCVRMLNASRAMASKLDQTLAMRVVIRLSMSRRPLIGIFVYIIARKLDAVTLPDLPS